ncbi:MAG: GSCFA domain-containing protein [Bacteroidales bacterium]|jgi:hypothetical protein|nr:GSCFA domain-containing protein [Bacteroidales bacterium]
MKFRSEITLSQSPFTLNPQDKIMLIGSCFTTHIGQFLTESGFDTCVNSFGTLFNPHSIAQGLNLTIEPQRYDERYIYHHEDYFVSFAHNTFFNRKEQSDFLQNIENQLNISHKFLKQAQYLFITFGTAFCYKFIERNLIVANCHKIPNFKFEKIRLTVDEIVAFFAPFFEWLKQENSTLKVIFTVSPVRHLSDGFHENTLSKSILHLAIEQLMHQEQTCYFPAYEILNDDLRDYRYYALDLCHPSEAAIQYVQECVEHTFFSIETRQKAAACRKRGLADRHLPLKNR